MRRELLVVLTLFLMEVLVRAEETPIHLRGTNKEARIPRNEGEGARTMAGSITKESLSTTRGRLDINSLKTASSPSTIRNETSSLELSTSRRINSASTYRYGIGEITALIPEANDAKQTRGVKVEDGQSGDTYFPHGSLSAIATVGEVNKKTGKYLVGMPVGVAAYLPNFATVRMLVQSAKGPYNKNPYPYRVNNGAVSFSGGHLQFVDYDRRLMALLVGMRSNDLSYSIAFLWSGEFIQTFYNVKGELVRPRNRITGTTGIGAHFSNTDPSGNYILNEYPNDGADWIMSRPGAIHLAPKYQWSDTRGFVDDILFTSESRGYYPDNVKRMVGLGSYAIDVKTRTAYALGVLGFGGYKKIVEIQSMHNDYVALALSGDNGDFHSSLTRILRRRHNKHGTRRDGQSWKNPKSIVPARVYIGKKGFMEDGSRNTNDFLARNGLRYGKVYGFATTMAQGRDYWHSHGPSLVNGAKVLGKWVAIDWQWNGVVRDIAHDGSIWEWQDIPYQLGREWSYWNGRDGNERGYPLTHNAADPRQGKCGFVLGSDDGYFGHYYVTGLSSALSGLSQGSHFPSILQGEYYVYQAEVPVANPIRLGGKGMYANGVSAKYNMVGDDPQWIDQGGQSTKFHEPSNIELVLTDTPKANTMHLVIQESSRNDYGERMFISSALEHENDGRELDYFFVAMTGGKKNTRNMAKVGIPAGVNTKGSFRHEFSSAVDISGLLKKTSTGNFWIRDTIFGKGHQAIEASRSVPLNRKSIAVTVAAKNYNQGMLNEHKLGSGGQLLLYQPRIRTWIANTDN